MKKNMLILIVVLLSCYGVVRFNHTIYYSDIDKLLCETIVRQECNYLNEYTEVNVIEIIKEENIIFVGYSIELNSRTEEIGYLLFEKTKQGYFLKTHEPTMNETEVKNMGFARINIQNAATLKTIYFFVTTNPAIKMIRYESSNQLLQQSIKQCPAVVYFEIDREPGKFSFDFIID